MNVRINELFNQAYGFPIDKLATINLEKFAELIVRECARLNLELSYELAGVIVDTEEGIGFDSVCLNTCLLYTSPSPRNS